MAKTITIPTNKGNPVQVVINGKRYKYTAGASVSVPDEVAALFDDNKAMEPVTGGDTTDLQKIEALDAKIGTLAGRVSAAEGEIDGLDVRLTTLDDEDTGIVPNHEGRITVLEGGGSAGNDTTQSEGT